MLPSDKQAVIANRVLWAKTYLKKAGLVAPTYRGHFFITDRGNATLSDPHARVDNAFLEQFDEFLDFQCHSSKRDPALRRIGHCANRYHP